MPKLTGIFETIIDLENIPVTDINDSLAQKRDEHELENFIANRILYPQTIPISKIDFDIDFAVLKEVIKRDSGRFFNDTLINKIIIPKDIEARFPPISRLIMTYLDALEPKGIIQVLLREEDKNMVIGSIIKLESDGKKITNILIAGKSYLISQGSFTILPLPDRHISIKIDASDEIVISGGKLGIVIDAR